MIRKITARDKAKVTWQGRNIYMVVPSVVTPGEPFPVRISAVGPDYMPISERIPLKLLNPQIWEGLPEQCETSPDSLCFDNVKIAQPGTYYLTAEIASPEGSAHVFSNPIWVTEDAPSRLFWGDIHVHSIDGWCQPYTAKSPEFGFWYARDVTFLDFVAITDHNDPLGLNEGKWMKQKALVRQYDQPGKFVPFLAFESSHATGFGGDNNVYFKGYDGDYFPRDKDRQDLPLEKLWHFLESKGHQFITISHHTGRERKYRSWDERRYEPKNEMLYEIYSMWGSSESHPSPYPLWQGSTDEPAYFVDALRRGCRFGVIASSDDHTTLPGSESSLRIPGRPIYGGYPHHGLAGIFATDLKRDLLWKAMRSRQTMAVTYGRPILFFEAEGHLAGAEVEADTDVSFSRMRHLRVRFIPAFPERAGFRLMFFRNGQPLAERRGQFTDRGEILSFDFTDDLSLEEALIRDTPFSERPFVVYHLRQDTDQGDTAWSSPIWFVK